MIFNSEYTGTSEFDNMVVTESPYPLGLEGALMHVYENECNYNAMMKAVGISELRYYQETGEDLFVQEAGAFSGFIAKAKAFFKKIIEKIKQIFHKFAAIINQYTMDDKKFVRKYEKELYRKNLTDFEFEGYTFKDLDEPGSAKLNYEEFISTCMDALTGAIGDIEAGKESEEVIRKITAAAGLKNGGIAKDSDALNDIKETLRGSLLKNSQKVSESEFRDELKEELYGDKESLEIKNIREWLIVITKASEDIKYANKIEKKCTSAIEKFIKALERIEKPIAKLDPNEKNDSSITEDKNKNIRTINDIIDLARSFSNDITVACGMTVQAFKDRNRQAKAICVKALSYKHESVDMRYESSYDSDDIFAGVVIR